MKAFEMIIPVLAALFSGVLASAQTSDSLVVDSLVYVPSARVDSSLVGKNIFSLMPSRADGDAADVHIYQPSSLVSAMKKTVESNSSRPYPGYRVRIFFDNRQTARRESEKMMEDFEKKYPGVPAYRSYVNPYFKITVGDFRTKSEAMDFLTSISSEFPRAFIVKENISYPAVDRDSLYVVDTVKILKLVQPADTLSL